MAIWSLGKKSGLASFDFVTDRIEGDYALELTFVCDEWHHGKAYLKFIKEELREAQILSWIKLSGGGSAPLPALLVGHTSYGELETYYFTPSGGQSWGDWWLIKCSFYYAEDYDVKRAELGYIDTETNKYHVVTSKTFGAGAPEPGFIYFGIAIHSNVGYGVSRKLRADLTQINFGREYFE